VLAAIGHLLATLAIGAIVLFVWFLRHFVPAIAKGLAALLLSRWR
jgi:hypothetical protein